MHKDCMCIPCVHHNVSHLIGNTRVTCLASCKRVTLRVINGEITMPMVYRRVHL